MGNKVKKSKSNLLLNSNKSINPILEKINSKFILKVIFSYINDENYEFKLFNYSHFFQNKLDIKLYHYQNKFFNKYFKNIPIDFNDYLKLKYDEEEEKNLKKIKNKLKDDISKYQLDINYLNEYIYYYFKKYLENIKSFENIKISIYSPFFEILSNSDIFKQIFTYISTYLIKKGKNPYLKIFNKLNESGKNYSSISFDYKNEEDFNYINELNIDFKNIRNFELIQNTAFSSQHPKTTNYDKIFSSFFSINNIENQLVYLNIKIGWTDKDVIEPNSLEPLNNFKLLNELKLYTLHFKSIFILRLPQLKNLYIHYCRGIKLDENSTLNLKKLFMAIENSDNHSLKFPELEECNIKQNISIIDFSSFTKLKTLQFDCNIEKEERYSILEKILSINTLQNLEICFFIDDIQLLNKLGKYTSIKKLTVINGDNNCEKECILYNFQNKFPNVEKFKFVDEDRGLFENIIIIKENTNLKINDISIIYGGNKNIQFYCGPFENLVSINLFLNQKLLNFEEALPIFKDNCQIQFKNLTTFSLYTLNTTFAEKFVVEYKIFNNIYNNLDHMPNLKHFHLECIIKDLDNEKYIKFIKKLLSKNLDSIKLIYMKSIIDNCNHEFYNNKELRQIYPNFELNGCIQIRKWNKNIQYLQITSLI